MKADSKKIILEFNLPDFERKDVKVKLSDNTLWVKASKKNRNKVKKKDFFHSEVSYQKFYYSTTLPRIDYKKAKIEFKKGVLKITAPRK